MYYVRASLYKAVNTLGQVSLTSASHSSSRIGPDHFATIAVQVLEQKAICQQDHGQDKYEGSAEYDLILVSSAGGLGTALNGDFTRGFKQFFALIPKYYMSVYTELFYCALSSSKSSATLLLPPVCSSSTPPWTSLLNTSTSSSPSARCSSSRSLAVRAVGRILVKNAAAMSQDNALPVFFDAFPLGNDFLQNQPLSRVIFRKKT
ncbi:hypothetical protein C2E23DRAFT_401906 [Lenzites betulinus]|nr:hypothetical protein C2E23DRAFT_401906 [Lenzites betulinus]